MPLEVPPRALFTLLTALKVFTPPLLLSAASQLLLNFQLDEH